MLSWNFQVYVPARLAMRHVIHFIVAPRAYNVAFYQLSTICPPHRSLVGEFPDVPIVRDSRPFTRVVVDPTLQSLFGSALVTGHW